MSKTHTHAMNSLQSHMNAINKTTIRKQINKHTYNMLLYMYVFYLDVRHKLFKLLSPL